MGSGYGRSGTSYSLSFVTWSREIVLVEEEEIARAMLLLLERKRVIAEGAGAAPLAALLSGKVKVREGYRVVLVVSGGNVDTPLLDRVIHQGLIRGGRVLQAEVVLEDVPGSLARLLSEIAGGRREYPPNPAYEGGAGMSRSGCPRRARGGDEGRKSPE